MSGLRPGVVRPLRRPTAAGRRTCPCEFGAATESLETSLAPWGAGFAAFFSGARARSVLWNGLGDPNLPESWVEGPRLGAADAPTAVGGRSGTWVAYVRRGRDATYVRRLRSSGRLGAERRRGRATTRSSSPSPRVRAATWRSCGARRRTPR